MKYIVAVSGGIDSVVLLDMLVRGETGERGRGISSELRTQNPEYVVAHVDHGIRPDSDEDARFVEQLAAKYALTYVTTRLQLGPKASEERARDMRYAWLREMQMMHRADAIVTAHHQDDVIETVMINLMRGTGWRGLCSLRTHDELYRPVLTMSKAEIVAYAIEHALEWHEDSTNNDPWYLRNFIRMVYMQRLTSSQRHEYIELYDRQVHLAALIDTAAHQYLAVARSERGLRRYALIMAGEAEASEVVGAWLGVRFQARSMRRLWHYICTARPSKRLHENGYDFVVTRDELIVSPPHI